MVKKMKNTNRQRYKKDFASQTEETKNKMKQTCLDRYDVEWASQNPKIVQKQKDTCIERYGTEWACQNEEIKEKWRNSQIEKYGKLYSQTDECKERKKQTCLKRYDVEYVLQSNIIKEKSKATCMNKYEVPHVLCKSPIREKIDRDFFNKYGETNPMRVPKIKEKTIENLLKNPDNNVKISKQQKHLCAILGGHLNYPELGYVLDIAFNQDKIYIEYNGGGHNKSVFVYHTLTQREFNIKELKRKQKLKNQGWKIIQFECKTDKLLCDEILIKIFDQSKKYLHDKHHAIKIYIDKNKVVCSQFVCTIDKFLNMNFEGENNNQRIY